MTGATLCAAVAVVALLLVPPGAAAPLRQGPLRAPVSVAGDPHPAANLTDGRHIIEVNASAPMTLPIDGATSYDPVLGGLVLFGGTSPNGGLFNETLLFRADRWTTLCSGLTFNQTCPTAPSARESPMMTYYSAGHELLLFGGFGTEGLGIGALTDTWALRNSTWVKVPGAFPGGSVPTESYGSLVDDPAAGTAFLDLPYDSPQAAAYVFENGSWRSSHPAPSASDVIYFDPATGELRASVPTSNATSYSLGPAGWRSDGLTHTPLGGYDATVVGATYDPLAGEELANVAMYVFNVTRESYSYVVEPVALSEGNWSFPAPAIAGSFPALWSGATETEPVGFAFDASLGAAVATFSNYTLGDTDQWVAGNSSTWLLTDPLAANLTAPEPATDVGVDVVFQLTTSGGFGGATGTFETDTLLDCTATTVEMSCTYPAPGTYAVSVVASDPLGDSTGAAASIVINPDPRALGTSTEATTTVGASVGFVGSWANGTAPLLGTWAFGDGTEVGASDPSHTYAQPGTYSADWSVVDAAGVSSVAHVTIVVNPVLAVDASVARVVVDAGVPDQFRTTLIGGTYPDRVAWAFGDGATSDLPNATHAYAAPGEYEAQVNATDYVGISAASHLYVDVDPAMVTAAGANLTTVAAGSPVLLAAGAVGGTAPYSYWWALGDGGWATSARLVHDFSVPGAYEVSVEVNDSAGGSQTDRFTVDVTPAPAGPAPPSGSPSTGGPGTPTGSGSPPSEFPRLTQQAGPTGPFALGDAILFAGIAAVLILTVGSLLDRRRMGRRLPRRTFRRRP